MTAIAGPSVRLGGYKRPILGPNLWPSSPTTFGAPNWTYADMAFTKVNSTGAWGGVNDIIPAVAREYEIFFSVSGSNSGGGLSPALADNSTAANSSVFPIAGNLANGDYVSRVTSNATNQALAFFSGAWQGTITVNYLKAVRPVYEQEGSGFSSGFSNGFG